MLYQKVACKAQVVEKCYYCISETVHLPKSPINHFFTLEASVGWGKNFLKIGNDFGAGR
jgi:hypothetical protein